MIVAAFIVQIVLLAKAVWLFREMINPDAISYLRIAGYYLNGQTDLMVSGVWGPLLSWLIVPWLLVFEDHLLAAHAAVAVSAVVFLFGTYSLLRAMRLPDAVVVLGTWITVFLSVAWSTVVISPDLLMAGLFCWGISRLWSDKWDFTTGIILGAAYLAKHAALPMSVMTIIGLGIINYPGRRAMTICFAGILLIAGLWIGLISYKYGSPAISTIGPIQHAIVGPADMPRDHPDHRHFYKPEPGRITVAEDPTNLPYNYWSPFESGEYAVHQVRIIHSNAHTIVNFLKSFDWLGLGLVSVIFGLFAWRKE